jgi:hypothetical protein
MEKDPIFLGSSGQFPTLKKFLGGYYYQTVWEDFSSDEEVWNAYAKRTDPQTIRQLVEQIDTLLKQPLEAIDHFFADAIGATGGLDFENSQAAKVWLNRFRTYMLSLLSQKP